MNVIKLPNNQILKDLKEQIKTKHKQYRMLKYCHVIDYNNGKLILNNLTKSLVWMSLEEFENIYNIDDNRDYIKFLIRNYFIVPIEYDEFYVVEELRKKGRSIIDYNYLDHPSEFTILTTTTCNARCFYCYEANMKKTMMKLETAQGIVEYIKEVAPTKDLVLRWFGGEPLVNMKAINYICLKLKDLGFTFKSSIITNGYLFNKETVEVAKTLWNLQSAQITLDGTEEIYNNIKAYVYKTEKSPYKIVLSNILELLDNEIGVTVRMNCDVHNANNLKELVKELSLLFPKEQNKYFSMYVYPLFELGDFKRTLEHKEELYNHIKEIEKLIKQCGHRIKKSIDSQIKCHHCMADTGNAVIISPNGDLGLCEHYIDKDFFSHINNPHEKNWDIINSWRDYIKPTEICINCPKLPSCLRLSKCPDRNICSQVEKQHELDLLESSMIEQYQKWRQERNSNKKSYSKNNL